MNPDEVMNKIGNNQGKEKSIELLNKIIADKKKKVK